MCLAAVNGQKRGCWLKLIALPHLAPVVVRSLPTARGKEADQETVLDQATDIYYKSLTQVPEIPWPGQDLLLQGEREPICTNTWRYTSKV